MNDPFPRQFPSTPKKHAAIDLVIFDCDGVLVDSELITMRTLVEVCKPLGLSLDIDEAMHLFRGGHWGVVKTEVEERLGRPLPDSFTDEFRTKLFEHLDNEVEAVPGIERVLDQIPYPFCVASNGPRPKMATTLGRIGLLHHFESRIYSAYDIDAFKPKPDLFLHAAQELGANPARCVVVEDSLNGVKAAKAAGMHVIAFLANGDATALTDHGALLLRDMKGLLEMIAELSAS